MAFDLNDTRTLLGVIEQAYPPNTLLVDTFFGRTQTFTTATVDVDYKKGTRKLAPFVVPGGKGVNMAREGFITKTYKAPTMKPKRVLSADDLNARMAGENVYSTQTPEQRAEAYRAQDLVELADMCTRREELMAAQLLINGEYDIKGFADDGKIALIDTVSFNFTQKLTLTGNDTWDHDTADILGVLSDASKAIRQSAGLVPTVLLCSEKTSRYILNNESIYKKLLIPSRDNMTLMSIQPQIQSPEVIRFGMINTLNLQMYTYDAIYDDPETNTTKQYIPDDYVIVGIPGKGRRLYGAVTQMEADKQFHTYAGRYVPKYTADEEGDSASLTLSSRCLVVPDNIDDWYVIKVK